MENFKTFITELFEIGFYNKQKKTYVVAVNDKIYLINSDMNCEQLKYLFIDLYTAFRLNKSLIKVVDEDNSCIEDVTNYIETHISTLFRYVEDIISGYIENEFFYIDRKGYTPDPVSSVMVNKIVKQLKIKKVKLVNIPDIFNPDYDVINYDPSIIKGKTPDIAYHGTASVYLKDILRIGIRPNRSPSNYSIKHNKLIFFTTSLFNALEYAKSAVDNNPKDCVPIVIKFEIPDKDLIIADYDIERFSGIDKYYKHIEKKYNINPISYKNDIDPDKIAKELGTYGYRGVVNPTNIKSVFLYNINENDDMYLFKNYLTSDFDEYTVPNLKIMLKKEFYDLNKGYTEKAF
jgi:hypothetical protein